MIKFEDFEAYVRDVIDGDTITVERGTLVLRIRVAHIDAPESGQPFSNEAREMLRKLCFQKFVHVHPIGADRYSRVIAEIRTEDCMDLSAEMIRTGMAWWLQGKKRDENYGEIESQAKVLKCGVHSIQNQQKPWNFRKKQQLFRAR